MDESLLSDKPALRIYLNQACAHRVLTKEEEQKLIRRFVRYRDMEKRSPKQEKAYLNLREEFISYNLKLVVHIAKGYKRHNTDLDLTDLISEGNIGLMSALRKFDPNRGFKFSTYAVPWIRQGIEKCIKYKTYLVKVPYNKIDRMRNLQKQMEEHSFPTQEEYKLTDEELELLNMMYIDPINIDELHRSNEARVVDESHKEIEAAILSEDIKNIIHLLKPIYRRVIELRFGFCEEEKTHSLSETSKELGCSKTWVAYLEEKSLKILKSIITHRNIVISNNV